MKIAQELDIEVVSMREYEKKRFIDGFGFLDQELADAFCEVCIKTEINPHDLSQFVRKQFSEQLASKNKED